MHDLARFLSDPLVLVALCAIGGGLVMGVVAWAFTGEYERGGYDSTHVRPADAKAKPWMLDTAGQPIVHTPKHKFAGDPDEGTRRLMPTTQTARARVVMIGPEGIEDNGNHGNATRRIRIDAGEGHEQEEGGADSERGEDADRSVEDGEEGGAYPREARTLIGWQYDMVCDRLVLLDSGGDLVRVVNVEDYLANKGSIDKDLFVNGLPMLPQGDIPYMGVKREV